MNHIDMIDPADPMSVLVTADWLEESGRTAESEALRTLAPPLEIYNCVSDYSCRYGDDCGCGYGYGDGDNDGYGDGYGDGDGYGYGYGYSYGCGCGCGDSYSIGDGHGDGFGHGELYGDGHRYGKGNVSTKIKNYLSHMRIFLNPELSICPGGGRELP